MNVLKKIRRQEGFTLIELIMVVIILGILAAVAVPRYLDMVQTAEEAAEDAVINNIRVGLEAFAMQQLMTTGRRTWPDNPFDALQTPPDGYEVDGSGNPTDSDGMPDTDGEWTFDVTGAGNATGFIRHQRNDNSRWHWEYNEGDQTGGAGAVGTLARDPVADQ